MTNKCISLPHKHIHAFPQSTKFRMMPSCLTLLQATNNNDKKSPKVIDFRHIKKPREVI